MNNFWIPIDKKYIDENLESLVHFLKSNSGDDEMRKQTIDALNARVEQIVCEVLNESLFAPSELTSEELIKHIRLVAYLILVSAEPSILHLMLLAYLLQTSPITTAKLRQDLVGFVTSLLSGSTIERLGFSWSDVPTSPLSIAPLVVKLTSTKLVKSMKQSHFEGKGCLSVTGGIISLAACNKIDFDKRSQGGGLSTLIDLYNIKVMVPNNELPSNLEKLGSYPTAVHNFLVEQGNVKSSAQIRHELRKPYRFDDVVTLHIDNVLKGFMNCVSVDPGYEVLSGSIFFKDNYVPGYLLSMIGGCARQLISKGSSLYVRAHLQDHDASPFIINQVFEDFYYDSAENFMEDETVSLAIAIGSNGLGNDWLTEEGFKVSIPDETYRDRSGEFARIKITKVDFDEATLYGEIVEDNVHHLVKKTSFMNDARKVMIEEFLHSTQQPNEEEVQGDNTFVISANVIKLLVKMLHHVTQDAKGSLTTFHHLALTRMLTFMLDEKDDTDYLTFEMDYLKAIVSFANNPNFVIPEIAIAEHLRSLDVVKQKLQILDVLRRYDTYIKAPVSDFSHLTHRHNDLQQISMLVELSNLLNGVVPETGLGPIKQLLCYNLGVEDDYTSIVSDKTDYGAELTGREFKSSIVYPPGNNMRPDLKKQLFNILKPVIGMLNSDKGGDIYIGVNDTTQKAIRGQLAQDMKYLIKNKLISEPSMDKYRLFLKYRIDEAFREESGNARGSDITAGRVDLIPEQSHEGVDVLHISVKPYEYDIVVFNPDIYPEQKQTYLRTSASTIVMNDEKKIQIRDRKSRIGGPGINIIHKLETAKREGLQVILKNYQSKSSTSDRSVEAYIILANQDVLICYELDKKENRVFKISRIGDVEITNTKWKNQLKYRQEPRFDLFGMMESENEPPIHLRLKLKNYAKTLLVEEYPRAKRLLAGHNPSTDKLCLAPDRKETWILDIQVFNLAGVARFYLGLAPFIEILEGEPLKEYLHGYIAEQFGGNRI